MTALCLAVTCMAAVSFGAPIPVPESVRTFSYPAITLPFVDEDPADSRPLALGPAASGGTTLRITVRIGEYEGPVDLIVAVYAPTVFSDDLLLFNDEGDLVPLSGGIVAWKTGITGPGEYAFPGLSTDAFPPGKYTFFAAVTPTGNPALFHAWSSALTIMQRENVIAGSVGSEGGTFEISDPFDPFYGTALDVAPDSFTETREFSLWSLGTWAAPAYPALNGPRFELTPDAMEPDTPVLLTVPYDPAVIGTPENPAVFWFNGNSGTWHEAPTEQIDRVDNLVTAELDRFAPVKVLKKETYFETELLRHDTTGKLRARVVFIKPFEEITPVEAGQDLYGFESLRAWLRRNPTSVHLVYQADLVKKAAWWDDEVVATQRIRYRVGEGEGTSLYRVFVDTEERTLLKSDDILRLTTVEDEWLPGKPALFTFDHVPEDEVDYYVRARLYLVAPHYSQELLEGTAGRAFAAVTARNYDNATMVFEKQSTVDTDLNGITDPFQPPEIYNGGVSPLSGNANTVFTFYVHYYSANGDPPQQKAVFIDGVGYTMEHVLGRPEDGLYAVTTALPEGDDHFFSFSFSDNKYRNFDVTRTFSGPVVTEPVGNARPHLVPRDLVPVEGAPTTPFKFVVDYQDPDGDGAATRTATANSRRINLGLSSGTADDGRYSGSTTLSSGCYCYSYSFTDSNNGSVRFPSLGALYGPAVGTLDENFSPAVLRIPSCRRNRNPVLSNGFVTPLYGDTCDTFTFSVDYYDPDGDSPNRKNVYIDGRATSMRLSKGSAANGTYTATLPLKQGVHLFHFFFEDGHCGQDRYPWVGDLEGPTVELGAGFSPSPACSSR